MTDPIKPSTVILEVTDHAVLRYLERSQGVDVEAVRLQIRDIVIKGAELGASAVTAEGLRFVLRNNSVTTVLPRSKPEGVFTHRDRRERD